MARPRKKLGDLLVEMGMITQEQLEEALKIQKETKERLGKVLTRLNYISEKDILEVLEFQLGIPKVVLSDYSLDSQTVHLIPEALARRHKVVPLRKEGNRLTLAMVDPLNVVAIDDVQLVTGCQVIPVIATEKEIDEVLDQFFQPGLEDTYHNQKEEFAPARVREDYNEEEAEGAVDDAPVVRVVNSIIQQAVRGRVSDIHIEPHQHKVRVRFRIDGMLRDAMNLPRQSHAAVASRIKIMADMDIAEKRIPQDGRIQIRVDDRPIDLRVSTIPTVFGEKIVIRILDRSTMLLNLNQLGFLPQIRERFEKIIRRPYGMLLITGPTGSGKTTTLYATLNELHSSERNIITIEDPVEYILEGINQISVNPKAGLTFANGLRAILRQDPDIIMVGEIRDRETAEIAVRAATTGHLVLSTLHTNDAAGAVTRLIDMGVEPFLVSSSLIGVVAQRLVRTICSRCREPYQLPPDAQERFFMGISSDEPVTLYRGRGCRSCDYTGYRGRVAIHEVLAVSETIRSLAGKRVAASAIRKVAVKEGMLTLREDGLEKVRQGITTIDEVIRVAFADEG
ncbi:type II secretion system ATPase GspE [Calderihabitans maritimus]|uniref:protein-secreting ATPase n=1 Tax=Calderihabitans maritimus TaxID=1246530 RepID=A0A1Z5HXI7_9FIRM|nr:type II secretion system ATPase GspE [Calderihabitans maritimus]GAW94128.1 type II secretion system protein E, GspE [Calderihabitans maritimus]